ncbi:MAG: long-chain fatty acid--CoA ligase [Chloroflexi bacterium]|nr:long-chain fatty acid--CoA ligase [Chloroflexota bacterium]
MKEVTGSELGTLPQYLKRNFELFPDRIAEREKDYGLWKTYTWREVYEQVKFISLGLVSLGVQRGDKVSIIGSNEPELYWSIFAVNCAGGVTVCLYPDSIPSEVEYIVKDSDSVFVIAEDQEQVDKFLEIKDRLPQLKRVIYWDSKGMWLYDDPILISWKEVHELGRKCEAEHPGLFEKLIEQVKPTDTAAVSYTSGTTGDPKGIIGDYRVTMDNVERLLSAYGKHLKEGAQYLTYISPAWGTEQLFGVSMGLVRPMVVNFPEEPETVLANIREVAPEFLMFGPRQWEMLVRAVEARMLDANWAQRWFYRVFMPIGHRVAVRRAEGKKVGLGLWFLRCLGEIFLFRPLKDKLGLIKVKIAITGGTSISPDIFYFFHGIGVELRQGYGASEVGLITTHFDDAIRFDTVGQIYRTNPKYGPPLEVRISEEGEILARGGSFFLGYYKKPEASAKKLDSEGWYQTGDAGYITEGGDVVVLDRLEDLRTLSTGYKFPPQFIEVRLRYSPFVREALVLGDETRPFVSALVDIDPETVGRWAERRRITYTTFPELSQKDEVRQLIQGEIAKVAKNLPPESRIRKFVNLHKPFDPDEGDLTRTRKLRRHFVEERYADIVESIYKGDEEFTTQAQVKYRDGRTGVITANVKINEV